MIVDFHTHAWEKAHLGKERNDAYERAHRPSSDETVVDRKAHYRTLTSQADKTVVFGFRSKWLGVMAPNSYVKTGPERLSGSMSVDPNYLMSRPKSTAATMT